jgi:hypothetical protein
MSVRQRVGTRGHDWTKRPSAHLWGGGSALWRASHERGEGEITLQLGIGWVERKLGSPGFLQLRLPQLPKATRGSSLELRGAAGTRSDNLNATKEQGAARTPRAVPGEAAAPLGKMRKRDRGPLLHQQNPQQQL